MIVLEYDSVEVDYCLACEGVWLDAGELEILFGDRAMIAGFMGGGVACPRGDEKRRPCPTCGRKMSKAATQGPSPVTYDHCDRGHGMWFDRGELGLVLTHGSSSPGGEQVTGWLRAMFSDEENGG